jgi:hypothetical protein
VTVIASSSRPPYNPGFGVDPPVLAGRDEDIEHILQALRTGPRDPAFGMALIGDRGIGKTVVLNQVQYAVHDDLGWPVVALQAVPRAGLLLPLAESLRHEAGSTWQRAGALVKELDKEISVSANLLVVQARAKVRSGPAPPPAASVAALERIFRAVGEAAAKRRAGVLITIDEAHVIPKTPDLAILGAAIQLVTKRKQLPVAVLLAGLPELRRRFRGVGTFLERLEVREIGNLSRESTSYALVAPAAERGVSFAAGALDLLVDRSGGYPYLVQLLGYRAWEAAGPRRQITLADAEAGAQIAQTELNGIHQAHWDALTELERDYVYVVASHGPGPVEASVIQSALGRTPAQLSSTRSSLIEKHRVVRVAHYGAVTLVWESFGAWVARHDRSVSRRPRRR